MDTASEPAGPVRRAPSAAEAKALGHPTRLRILFACRDRARTNKDLAELLGSTPGTIHYHLRSLLDQGFLRAEEARPGPRGSREQPYRATGRSWGVSGDPATSAASVETSLDEIAAGDGRVLAVSRLELSLPADEVDGFVAEVQALLDRVAVGSGAREPDSDEDERVAVFFAVTRDAPAEGGEVSARERWNERYRDRPARDEPDPFVMERLPLLPRSGRALDLAGGGGRHAIVLAAHGLDVTLIDVSDVACAAARARARAAGVDVEVVRRPLTPGSLPPGPFAAVLAHHYLDVAVWEAAVGALRPGGVALFSQPTVRNLEHHPRPGRRWLLEEGRMHELVGAWCARRPGLEVVEMTEGWTGEGHHEARAVLRQRPG